MGIRKSKDGTEVYLGVVDRLEPFLTEIDTGSALASIAISLRRIADELELTNRLHFTGNPQDEIRAQIAGRKSE